MSNLGMGVMIGLLSGNESSVQAYQSALNKAILRAGVIDDRLLIRFEDGSELSISDEGQSCCEHRYMVCDDDLKPFIGAKLLSASIKDAPSIPVDCGDHEIQFLEVTTDKGVFQCATHNVHNGYYGGFSIRCHYKEAQ